MRTAVVAGMASVALVLGPVGPAVAESTTVEGTNAFEKMTVSNGEKAVVVKAFAPGGADCDIKYISVKIRGTTGKPYTATGGCYGVDWVTSLSRGTRLLKCKGFRLTWNAKGGFWRVVVPRTCATKLTPKIKVSAFVDDWSPMPGEAGPTKWLKKG